MDFMGIYPQARMHLNIMSSSFYMNLAQHIDLEGLWLVALMEILYLHTRFNVPQVSDLCDWQRKPCEWGDGVKLAVSIT